LADFGAVILAAGLSRRMDGPNKLLQPWRGRPLIAHACATAASLNLRDCVVVTGRDALDIANLATAVGVRTVHNPAFADGLGSSIAAGASAISTGLLGIFIVLGDMPLIDREDYAGLAAAFAYGRIIIPEYQGMRGHPVLFCASFRGKLQNLSGDEGARSIVNAHKTAVLDLALLNPGVLADFDKPQDFQN
jgi:molybdenum cofactor cytidylyltransferase